MSCRGPYRCSTRDSSSTVTLTAPESGQSSPEQVRCPRSPASRSLARVMIVTQSLAIVSIVRLFASFAIPLNASNEQQGTLQWIVLSVYAANALLLIKHSFSFIFHSIGRLHHLKKWNNWCSRQYYLDSKKHLGVTTSASACADASAVACTSPNARHVLYSKFQDSYFVTKQRQLLGISYFILAHYLLLSAVGFLVNERTSISTSYFEPLGAVLLMLSLVLLVRVQWRYIIREVNIKENVKIAVAVSLHASCRIDSAKHSFTSNIAANMSNCLVQLPVDISLQAEVFQALALLLEVKVHWYEHTYYPIFKRMYSSSIGYDEVSQLAIDIRSLEVALVESYYPSSSDNNDVGRRSLLARGEDMQRQLSRRILLMFASWLCNILALLFLLASFANFFFIALPVPFTGSAMGMAMKFALLLGAAADVFIAKQVGESDNLEVGTAKKVKLA